MYLRPSASGKETCIDDRLKEEIITRAREAVSRQRSDENTVLILCQEVSVSVNADKNRAIPTHLTELLLQELPELPDLLGWALSVGGVPGYQRDRQISADASNHKEPWLRQADAPMLELQGRIGALGVNPDLNAVTALHVPPAPAEETVGCPPSSAASAFLQECNMNAELVELFAKIDATLSVAGPIEKGWCHIAHSLHIGLDDLKPASGSG